MIATNVVLSSDMQQEGQAKQWFKAFLIAALILALCLFAQGAFASDGTEFAEASSKFETWVKGNMGKLAALACLAVGSFMAAIRKDWSWFGGAVALSILVGIVVGIINASFTATI